MLETKYASDRLAVFVTHILYYLSLTSGPDDLALTDGDQHLKNVTNITILQLTLNNKRFIGSTGKFHSEFGGFLRYDAINCARRHFKFYLATHFDIDARLLKVFILTISSN